jgi:hypothetical protein
MSFSLETSFLHDSHLQISASQRAEAAKHWQYSLRHLDFLQVHPGVLFAERVSVSALGLGLLVLLSLVLIAAAAGGD